MMGHAPELSPELERLLGERISALDREMRVRLALACVGGVVGYIIASVLFRGIEAMCARAKAQRRSRRREESARQSPVGP